MHGVGRRDRDLKGPSLTRAHVSGSLSLGLENGPRGRTLGVGEEPSSHAYRWPPLSPVQEREFSSAYTAITGRQVWRSVLPLLILGARLHGPDTASVLRELYQDGGVQDLLKRLIAYPPRLAPHPDYAISTTALSQPTRPADLPTVAPAQAVREQRVERAAKERTPGGLTPIAALLRRPADEQIAPSLRREPVSAPDQDARRATVGESERRQPSGTSPVNSPRAQRSRPPDCPYPRHEPTWVQRPDGTWRCRTCHP
jgi:hypothetical protein